MIAAVPMNALTPLLAPAADDAGRAQLRANVRRNLFVAAMLSSDGSATPVRIRNLSCGGALIEAAAIPPEDASVQLLRGSLVVAGRIAWRRDDRAGIRFDTDIAVGEWLPGGNRRSGQQRVDEIVHACRTGGLAPGNPDSPSANAQSDAARHLLEYGETLNAAAEELASDPATAATHPTTLQTIDVLGKKLRALAARLLHDGGG